MKVRYLDCSGSIDRFIKDSSSKYHGLTGAFKRPLENASINYADRRRYDPTLIRPSSCKISRRIGFGLIILIEVVLRRSGRNRSGKLLFIYDWYRREFIETVTEITAAKVKEVQNVIDDLSAIFGAILQHYEGPVLSYWFLHGVRYYATRIPDDVHDEVIQVLMNLPYKVDLENSFLGVDDEDGRMNVALTFLLERQIDGKTDRRRFCYVYEKDTKRILYRDHFSKGDDPDGFSAAAHLIVKDALGLTYS